MGGGERESTNIVLELAQSHGRVTHRRGLVYLPLPQPPPLGSRPPLFCLETRVRG